MQPFRLAILAVLTLATSWPVYAQTEVSTPVREVLRPLDSQKRGAALDRHALDLRTQEFFAKPGRFELYEVDISALERKGEVISISVFGEEPLKFLSHGVIRDPAWHGMALLWNGELLVPGKKENVPVELFIGVRSVDPEGNVRPPDPNREATISALKEDRYVIFEESVNRLNERLVYKFGGNSIYVPSTSESRPARKLVFHNADDNYDFVAIYEEDATKVIYTTDATEPHGGDAAQAGHSALASREDRVRAFEEYVNSIRGEIEAKQQE